MFVLYRKNDGIILQKFKDNENLSLNGIDSMNCFIQVDDEDEENPVYRIDQCTIKERYFEKLEIRRVFRALGQEDALDALLNSNEQLKKDWYDASIIDLNDEIVILALSNLNVDINVIKKVILENRKE
jgi:hypothetical protein